jgi:hypothetical protein
MAPNILTFSTLSVKLLLAFASTVIPGLSLLEIHDQYFYSLLDMYVFRNGASSSTKERSVFLCRLYVCYTSIPQIRESLTWRCMSPYLYPPGTEWPYYTPRHWVPFSSPPTTRRATVLPIWSSHGPQRKHRFQEFLYCCVTCSRPWKRVYRAVEMFSLPLPSNG